MSRGNEMRSLVDGIKASSDCRTKTLQDVASSTQKTLKDTRNLVSKLAKDHKEMANILRIDLSNGVVATKKSEAVRVKAAKDTMSNLKKESSAAKSIWQSLSNKNGKIVDEEVKVKKSKKVE